jgi:hypothetical protein
MAKSPRSPCWMTEGLQDTVLLVRHLRMPSRICSHLSESTVWALGFVNNHPDRSGANLPMGRSSLSACCLFSRAFLQDTESRSQVCASRARSRRVHGVLVGRGVLLGTCRAIGRGVLLLARHAVGLLGHGVLLGRSALLLGHGMLFVRARHAVPLTLWQITRSVPSPAART